MKNGAETRPNGVPITRRSHPRGSDTYHVLTCPEVAHPTLGDARRVAGRVEILEFLGDDNCWVFYDREGVHLRRILCRLDGTSALIGVSCSEDNIFTRYPPLHRAAFGASGWRRFIGPPPCQETRVTEFEQQLVLDHLRRYLGQEVPI